MGTMSDSFRRAGLADHNVVAASGPGTHTAAPTDPPEESSLRYAAACVLLGRALTPTLTPAALASRLAECQDGSNRGRAAWEGGLRSRLGKITGRQAKAVAEVSDLAASLTGKGIPTWTALAEEVERALTEGHAERWLKEQSAAATAASATAIPTRKEAEGWPEYGARVEDWALDLSVEVLRRLFPPSWSGGGPDIAGYVARLERQDREAAAAAAASRVERDIATAQAEILRRLAAGTSARDLVARVACSRQPDGYYRPLCRELGLAAIEGLTGGEADSGLNDFVANTPQGWDAALPRDGTPPQGWPSLADDALRRYAAGQRHEDTCAHAGSEALRRWGAGYVYAIPNVRGSFVTTPTGMAAIEVHETRVLERVSLIPAPAGWVEPVKADRPLPIVRWCGPEVAAALTRLESAAQRPGTLDVRRAVVAGLYGRHETKNFPRFHKGGIMVGVEDRLGQILDDLALVYRMATARVPPEAWLIHAAVRKTAAGGLQMVAGQQVGALLVVKASDSLGPKRSAPSGDDAPRADSSALAVTSTSSYRAHHQTLYSTTTFAVVEPGKPLLMESGIGYRFGEGRVWRVPGLAEGRSGTPEPM